MAEQVKLYLGDCLDILPTLEAGSVALGFIDLPYGLGVADWDSRLSGREAIPIVRSKIIDGGSIYATCTAHILATMMSAIKWRRIIAWGKPNLPFRKGLNEWEWSTEFILWETLGDPRTFHKPEGEASRDYWRLPVENGFLNPDGFKHPARKPLALMMRIIEASTDEGDAVLDPFTGSGTTGVACVQTGRNFIGIEIDPGYFEIAKHRIEKAQQEMVQAEMTI